MLTLASYIEHTFSTPADNLIKQIKIFKMIIAFLSVLWLEKLKFWSSKKQVEFVEYKMLDCFLYDEKTKAIHCETTNISDVVDSAWSFDEIMFAGNMMAKLDELKINESDHPKELDIFLNNILENRYCSIDHCVKCAEHELNKLEREIIIHQQPNFSPRVTL